MGRDPPTAPHPRPWRRLPIRRVSPYNSTVPARLVALLTSCVCAVAIAAPTRVTLQRGISGTVQDCYIWSSSPTTNGNSTTLYTGLVGAGDKNALLQFDLSPVPDGARILDARLLLKVTGNGGVPIRVHRITAAWAETAPNWNTFGSAYDTAAVTTFTTVAGHVFVGLTALTQAWVDGEVPNYGVMLVQDPGTASSTFSSSEISTVSERPSLDVLYEVPGPLVAAPTPALDAACQVPFRFPLKAAAPDATSFTLAGAPGGLTLDASSGDLSWTPVRDQKGEHTLSVTVSDGRRTATLPVVVNVQCAGPLKVGLDCTAVPGSGLTMLALALLALRRRVVRR